MCCAMFRLTSRHSLPHSTLSDVLSEKSRFRLANNLAFSSEIDVAVLHAVLHASRLHE